MNAKELRIGNFFHKIIRSQEVHLPDTSTIFEITAIPSYGVEAVRLGEIPAQVEHHDIIEFYNLSPIPITEERLPDCRLLTAVDRLSKSAENTLIALLKGCHPYY